MANGDKFFWPKKPACNVDFEALMRAMDEHLAAQGLKPFQRPLNVPRCLWDAFRWEGPILPPKEMAALPGFDGPILMAKCHQWYEHVYGDKLKGDFAFGYAPFRLGAALWRVRFPVFYGRCRFFIDPNLANRGVPIEERGGSGASMNMLCMVEKLTSGLAERITSDVLDAFVAFYRATHQALMWRDSHLTNHPLFDEGRADYSASVDDVLDGRYAQSRWASAQAVEKTIKAILARTNVAYPKGGRDGHNLLALGTMLNSVHGIELRSDILTLVQCSPAVRYGEEESTQDQALSANHASIAVIEMLMSQHKVETLLAIN